MATVLGISILPIVESPIPPIGDYPAHLARIFILNDLLGPRHFASQFQIVPQLVPNLAMDGIILALMRAGLPVEVAGRCFLALQICIVSTGVIWLHASNFRRLSPWPLLAAAFAYNEIFLWGFSNFLFGTGLALIFCALHIQLNRGRRTIQLVVFAIGLACTCLSHLMAMFLLVGLILSYEAWEAAVVCPSFRRATAAFGHLCIACAALGLISRMPLFEHPDGGATGLVLPVLSMPSLATIRWRLHGLLYFAYGYDRWLDLASVTLIVLIVGAAFFSRVVRVRTWGVLACLGLLAIYLVVPERFSGTDYIPDRIPIWIFLIALSAIDIAVYNKLAGSFFTSIVVALVIVRTSVILMHWRAFAREQAPLLQAISAMPIGARIYTVYGYQKSYTAMLRQGWLSLPAYAVWRRYAYYSGTFAIPGQNIVVRTPEFAAAPAPPHHFRADQGRPNESPFAGPLLRFYNYIFITHPGIWPEPVPSRLHLVVGNADYALYHIDAISARSASDKPAIASRSAR